jgi:hypothetical protein
MHKNDFVMISTFAITGVGNPLSFDPQQMTQSTFKNIKKTLSMIYLIQKSSQTTKLNVSGNVFEIPTMASINARTHPWMMA